MKRMLLVLLGVICIAIACSLPNPQQNSLRVIVSSDIGGDDDDDIQSFIHYLVYSDLFDTEGLIASPPAAGRAEDFVRVIDVYAKDFPAFKKHSQRYPHPDSLRTVVRQGAVDPAPDSGYSFPTPGSQLLVERALANDDRPLYVLVWGSITDVAQALHDNPAIKSKLRVYFIASWNRYHDENAFRYIETHHSDLWIIQCETTFRGWYCGGDQAGDLGNTTFINQHIKGHGALGDLFAPLKNNSIKMGDTPSVAWLLSGHPNDPSQPGWGGRFIKHADRPNWWIDDPGPAFQEKEYAGAKTVNAWRQQYLRDWQHRMDRCKQIN